MEKHVEGFLIKKSTMITKNAQPITDVYKLDKKALGSGTYGVVSKATHLKTGQVRACKTIARKKIKNWERFQTEVKILQTLDHPNIIKLYEYFEDEKNVYLLTEMCSGGELFDKIIEKEFFEEKYAARIFKQILNAINYCHKLDIAHRDLKPENFLYETKKEDAEIKVIDFGLSKICHTKNTGKIERLKTRAGTPYYISPEVLAGNYDKSCDLWSAGCIMYILLCGYPPFYGDDDQEILRMVQKGKYDFDGEEWEEISKEAKDLIKKLITKPERRLTAQEALDHKWFKIQLKGDDAQPKYLKKRNLNAFKKFMKGQKLQQAALTAIAVQASPDDIKDLKETFQALDKNGDGSITFEELKAGLGHKENAETLIELLRGADTDNSGSIDYTEFLAATMDA